MKVVIQREYPEQIIKSIKPQVKVKTDKLMAEHEKQAANMNQNQRGE